MPSKYLGSFEFVQKKNYEDQMFLGPRFLSLSNEAATCRKIASGTFGRRGHNPKLRVQGLGVRVAFQDDLRAKTLRHFVLL